MSFKKIVRFTGSKRGMLQYPLTTGESEFVAGVDYEITNRRDYARLMNSTNFVDVTPVEVKLDVATAENSEEVKPIAVDEEAPKTKKTKKDFSN